MTKYWVASKECGPEHEAIAEAAKLLRQGELIAFPTETVYGLGADARNSAAVEAIFSAKGRPSDNPLIVHIAEMGMLNGLVERVDPVSRRLAEAFWPGPLTLVLPLLQGVLAPSVTAGLDTVGIRMPDHPVALALITAAGCPVAAPSANRSGRPSPTLARHVEEDLGGRIAGLLDGGPTGVGLESTVAMVSADGRVHVLRPGGITPRQLEEASGCPVLVAGLEAGEPIPSHKAGQAYPEGAGKELLSAGAIQPTRLQEGLAGEPPVLVPGGALAAEQEFRPRAPGMKYTHYAPRGRLTVVAGADAHAVTERIGLELAQAKEQGERTAVLAPREHAAAYEGAADLVLACGSLADAEATGRELFAALRRLDEDGMTCIFAEAFPEEGVGLAVMNRLLKAAGHRVLEA